MASKAASKRLTKEYVAMQKDPPPFVYAVPEEKNILTWHYIIRGPPDSPYAGGEYHGVILFPSEYPFKPPGIKMITPSGRFQPDKKICFSMSDFHPGTWNPAWSVATILTGLLSFMLSDEMTTGSVTTSDADKRSLALRSHAFNRVNKRFKDAFPDYCDELPKDLPNMGEKERGTAEAPEASATATTAPEASTSVAATAETTPLPPSTGPKATNPKPVVRRARGPVVVKGNGTVDTPGWAAAWRKTIWEKWRWGVLIAVAVIVSRLSS